MTDERLCRNEGCPKPPEPGEDYCWACCLEHSLFQRNERWAEPQTPEHARAEREAAKG